MLERIEFTHYCLKLLELIWPATVATLSLVWLVWLHVKRAGQHNCYNGKCFSEHWEKVKELENKRRNG